MSQIIMFPQQPKGEGIIDVSNVQKSCRKLKAGLIAPATEAVQSELAREHAAEPIKSMDEIVAQIGPTAEILESIRPVYNFKAAD